MVTPFDASGGLDLDGAVTLARYLVAHGSDGLVLTGSTGEAATLADEERVALWRSVAEAVSVPVLAGATSNDTRHSIELTKLATEAGVDGILAVAPYYNRPSQAGIAAHFTAIAAVTPLPIVLYDIPVRTGRKIAAETILLLASEVENIVGLKDATGDAPATARLLARLPTGFECYCGDDLMTLPLLSVGAVGLIGVATHWCGVECGEMINRFRSGDLQGALEVARALIPSFVFESSDDAPNPVPVKAVLRALGLPAGECRLPLGPTPAGLEEGARTVLSDLEAWRQSRGAGG
jgi:4-hydroxy-tetrahydrodipicolinate synthase